MPPKKFIEIIWTQIDPYRSFPIWTTYLKAPIYAVRVGTLVKSSLDLKLIHNYVDEYLKTKLN